MLIKFAFALLLFAIGTATVYFLARIHTIECVRDREGRVGATITHSGINYCKKERIAGGELLRAELEVDDSLDSEGESSTTSYRVRLIAVTHTTFLTNTGSSNYVDISRKVEQINYFIHESTQKSMSLTQDARLIGYVFGGVFGIIAPLTILLIPTRG
jgi:hypothetical protein